MRPLYIVILTLAAAWTFTQSGCSDVSAQGRPQRITITGSSTVAPLIGELAKQYERRHPGVRIDVQAGGSSRGIADTRNGLADIGMISRDPYTGEADLHIFPIAKDGICLIAHRDNPIHNLNHAQIIDIYTGKITTWAEINGMANPITVVSKAEGRSTLELFLKHFNLTSRQLKPSVIIGDNQQGIKTIAANSDALGYVSIGSAEYEANRGTTIKLLTLDGEPSSVAAVRAGKYPLARTLNLVTKYPPAGVLRRFIEFVQSPAAHPAIEGQYFVPITD